MVNFKVGLASNSNQTLYLQGLPKKNFPLFNIGKHSYIDGYGSYIRTSIEQDALKNTGNFVHNICIGNYCSIATEVTFCVGSNHPYLSLSQQLSNDDLKKYPNKGQILIQNDVWIGHGATIMAGVTVHNGALIAAGSHVVKDVPAYAIVGGNPAQIIGYRFSKDIIKKLQLIKWWNWSDEKKLDNLNYFKSASVEEFCNKFYADALKNLKKVKIPAYYEKFSDKKIYLYFVDFNSNFFTYKRVLEQFFEKYSWGVGWDYFSRR